MLPLRREPTLRLAQAVDADDCAGLPLCDRDEELKLHLAVAGQEDMRRVLLAAFAVVRALADRLVLGLHADVNHDASFALGAGVMAVSFHSSATAPGKLTWYYLGGVGAPPPQAVPCGGCQATN